MPTLDEILADLDDLKSALYDCESVGNVSTNICDQAQELLREVYALLEGDVE
jgi:hypothetical protein